MASKVIKPKTNYVRAKRNVVEGNSAMEKLTSPVKRRKYVRWTETSEELLLEWLELKGNYRRYKSASAIKESSGRPNTNGATKVSISKDIQTWLATRGCLKDDESIRIKIQTYETSGRKAYDFLLATGEGLNTEDEKLGVKTIRGIFLLSILSLDCLIFWDSYFPIVLSWSLLFD